MRAEGAIPAAAHMVFANVVFTGEGMLIVPGTLIDWSTLRAATVSVVHTRFHFGLPFNYGSKGSTLFSYS